jgi:hypothetical protein
MADAKTRKQPLRQRRQQAGLKAALVWLAPAGQTAMAALRQPGETVDAVVNRALVTLQRLTQSGTRDGTRPDGRQLFMVILCASVLGLQGSSTSVFPLVGFAHEGLLAVFTVARTALEGLPVFFQQPDCQGPPFTILGQGPIPIGALAAPGLTVYIPDLQSTPQTVTIASEELNGGPCSPVPGPNPPIPNVVPAIPLVELPGHFAPPFSVHVQGKHAPQ